MADEARPFLISVRRRWLLWILPIIAALYFIAVLVLVIGDWRIRGVTNDMLVLGGLGLFALVILIELPFLIRRRAPRAPKPKKEKPAKAVAVAEAAPSAWDDELVITSEAVQGMRVLEYSAPAKSANPHGVYTKTHVPVTQTDVVRVETLVAEQGDL